MGNSSSRRRNDRPANTGAAPVPPPYPPPVLQPPQAAVYGGRDYGGMNEFYQGWRPGPYGPPGHPYLPPGQYVPGPPVPPVMPPAPAQEFTQTATIRNAVNLKKDTLQLTPVGGDANKLAVSFQFDASSPCCVTTFVSALEEPSRGCRLTPSKQPAKPAALYPKGLRLKYPRAGEEAGAAVIDLALYGDGGLTRVTAERYPLVIRLETLLPDKAAAENHTLEELVPGAEQKEWVQSQTTFAVLQRDEEGRWVAKVLKQKIWVDSTSYELQEIYGMEHTAAGRAANEGPVEDLEERLCVICLVNERDTTVLPCRHMCMCHECAQELRKQTSKCPICRNHVESLLHIKVSKGRGRGQAQAPPAAPAAATNGQLPAGAAASAAAK